MKNIQALAAVVTSTILFASPAAASGLVKGGFESPPTPGMNFSTAPAGFG